MFILVDISASITESGNNIAGEIYSLVCSVTVTGSTEQPTITWLDSMNNQITSGVVTTGSISTLMFSPLAASHAGTYTCRATLGSAEMNGSTEVSLRGIVLSSVQSIFLHSIHWLILKWPIQLTYAIQTKTKCIKGGWQALDFSPLICSVSSQKAAPSFSAAYLSFF